MGLDKTDIGHLERAMALAEIARGCTTPNPIVGALIVKGRETLGPRRHARTHG